MARVVHWSALCAVVEPVYPKAGKGWPPIALERMLRILILQQCFNLGDPAVEEALYDSQAMREFVGIDLGREPAPDETTVPSFASCSKPMMPALLESPAFGRAPAAIATDCYLLTSKACRTFDVTCAIVLSDLRVRTKRTGARRAPSRGYFGVHDICTSAASLCDDLLRRFRLFYPIHQTIKHIELIGGKAS